MLRLRRFKTLLMVCYAKYIYMYRGVHIYSVDPFDRVFRHSCMHTLYVHYQILIYLYIDSLKIQISITRKEYKHNALVKVMKDLSYLNINVKTIK